MTPTTQNALARSCNSDEGQSTNPTHSRSKETDMTSISDTAPQSNDLPPLDTPEQRSAEVAWCSREAVALFESDDHERRRLYIDRKRRLLAALDDFELGPAPQTYTPDDADRASCPSWCQEHWLELTTTGTEGVGHKATVQVGEAKVDIEMNDAEDVGAAVFPPDIEWINGQELRDYIAALTLAADLIEGSK